MRGIDNRAAGTASVEPERFLIAALFPGPPSRELVEAEIGTRLEVSGTYTPYEDGGVIVFSKNGTVQRAVRLEPYPFDGNAGSYSRAVLVARPHPSARSLQFIDPTALRTPRLR